MVKTLWQRLNVFNCNLQAALPPALMLLTLRFPYFGFQSTCVELAIAKWFGYDSSVWPAHSTLIGGLDLKALALLNDSWLLFSMIIFFLLGKNSIWLKAALCSFLCKSNGDKTITININNILCRTLGFNSHLLLNPIEWGSGKANAGNQKWNFKNTTLHSKFSLV